MLFDSKNVRKYLHPKIERSNLEESDSTLTTTKKYIEKVRLNSENYI